MTATEAETDPLDGLARRLRSGVMGAPALSHLGASGDPKTAWRRVCPLLATLSDWADRPWGQEAAGVEAMTGGLAQALVPEETERHSTLRVLLTTPHFLVTGSDSEQPPQGSPAERWAIACRAAEAVWSAVESADQAETRRLLPLAARLRFLVLSEPFRHRQQDSGNWVWGAADAHSARVHGVVGWAFGAGSEKLLLARARAARRDWQSCLDSYQSHPLLSAADPAMVEAELSELATAQNSYWRGPLVLSSAPLDKPAPPDGEDEAVSADVVERHLLPRFQLLSAAGLALYGHVPGWNWFLPLTVVGAAAGAFGLAVSGLFTPAAGLGAAAYLLAILDTAALGRQRSAPWALRIPAACAVGLVVLVAFPDWWQRARLDPAFPSAPWAAVLLAAVAWCYLVVEARNHGVSGGQALARALGVTALGAAHAFLVSLIGLVAVAPVLADTAAAARWESLWHGTGGDPWAVLVLATGWCLAVGVFSQILWDDRPITAPLAHLRWQR
ncbi:hypothetical protein [Nocardiopsis ansamitocini]|uniref:Uncharacterized protein n=1 Tax=Nocardiopsis ansamitocini TaxID=1670832 RepID=A0A9W6P9H2_9ACTN|nr:hypothetical protein [Nocardiopsis ansamitocini]GLU49433.1 hypothetical protein Nans01_37840 [Nocardiopsis ansamitocini]